MKVTLIRYMAHPEFVDHNETKIKGVFDELVAKNPSRFCYLVLRLEDGEFIHLAFTEATETSPLTELATFNDFRQTGAERWADRPKPSSPKIVGIYGCGTLPSSTSEDPIAS
jgi:predicted SnoaL-like aldol condensation-catalyzing enzyme